MKVGVISDTHIPVAEAGLPQQVVDIMSTMDAVIHAGDFVDMSVVETFEHMGPFYGVCGNMDPSEIRAHLPEKRVVELAGISVGIMHGWGSPNGLEHKLLREFAEQTPDVLVFGHSHQPTNTLKDGVLLFNPGSPTDTRFAPRKTVGVLTIDGTVSGEIVNL